VITEQKENAFNFVHCCHAIDPPNILPQECEYLVNESLNLSVHNHDDSDVAHAASLRTSRN